MRAVGIDRFNPPHDRGSSHGQTRVIRQAYFEHPDYVPLLEGKLPAVARAGSRRQARRLFHEVGLLEVGPADGVVVPGVLRAAAEHGLDVEQISAGEIERRWPGLRVPGDLVGVFEQNAGYLLVEDCVAANLDGGASGRGDAARRYGGARVDGGRARRAGADECRRDSLPRS